jgi:cold shock CspA family protein
MDSVGTVRVWRREEGWGVIDSPDTPDGCFAHFSDTVVNGMDYILLDADGKIAEVTIWWRPLPSGVQMQGHLAGLLGMQPWELLTDME